MYYQKLYFDTPSLMSFTGIAGEELKLQLKYETFNQDGTRELLEANHLRLYVHYDSSVLTKVSVEDTTNPLIFKNKFKDDSSNNDSDDKTDKIIELQWTDLSNDWPWANQEDEFATIANIKFKVDDEADLSSESSPLNISIISNDYYYSEGSSKNLIIGKNPSYQSAPILISSNPANNATVLEADSNIFLTFAKVVDIETGNITIKKTADDSILETIDITSDQVTGTGTNQITINPINNFASETSYYVLIDSTAFDDAIGISYPGITDTTTLTFTTADFIAPTLIKTTPADNASQVEPNININLNFSEIVDIKTGKIYIKKSSDDLTVETIDVTSNKVYGSGSKVITIDPSADLAYDTDYYVQISEASFDDVSGNSFEGIIDKTSFSFSTIDTTAPRLSKASINTSGTKAILTFNEALSATTAVASAFAVTNNDANNSITDATVSGTTVELTLTNIIKKDEAVIISYKDPSSSDDTNAIQDEEGNDVNTFTISGDINNSTATGSSSGSDSSGFSTTRDNIKIETSEGTYYIIKEAKTFSDAKSAAESDGGFLASFETENEYTLLYNAVAKEYERDSSWGSNTVGAGLGVYLRIGGTDGDTVSSYDSSDADWNWKWVSDNSEISRDRDEWGVGTVGKEPTDGQGNFPEGQDSLAMGLTGWGGSDRNKYGDAGEWNDVRDSSELYYLVEVPSTNDKDDDFKKDNQSEKIITEPYQTISTANKEITFSPGGEVSFDLIYTTSDEQNELPGLGLKVHYDSSIFTPSGENSGVTASVDTFTDPSINDDSDDLDNNSNTDKYLSIIWTDFMGKFPGGDLPANLANIKFTSSEDGLDNLTGETKESKINFTSADPAQNYDFLNQSVVLTPQTFNLDVDGDGNVTALGDGLMVIRKLFGAAFADGKLTDKAISYDATRDSQGCHDYIETLMISDMA